MESTAVFMESYFARWRTAPTQRLALGAQRRVEALRTPSQPMLRFSKTACTAVTMPTLHS